MTIIYKIDTGEIITASEHPMPDNVLEVVLAGGGKAAIDGFCEVDEAYVHGGRLVYKPTKPGDSYVFNMQTKQWELSETLLVQEVLERRQYLLITSDWTQLPDVPLNTKEEWAVYRQALRDITEQPGYPLQINWPTAPGQE